MAIDGLSGVVLCKRRGALGSVSSVSEQGRSFRVAIAGLKFSFFSVLSFSFSFSGADADAADANADAAKERCRDASKMEGKR